MLKNIGVTKGRSTHYHRRIFIIFLVFTFLITAGSLFLRNSISKKLQNLGQQYKDPLQSQEINNVLLDLNSAENDFQKASLYGGSEKLESYKIKLTNVFNQINTILNKYKADIPKYFPAGKGELEKTFDRKLSMSKEVFKLKHKFDSLLNATTIQGIKGQGNLNAAAGYQTRRHFNVKNGADTLVKEINAPASKNGLFKRLRDAFNNKNQAGTSVRVLTVNRVKQISDSVTRSLVRKQNLSVEQLVRELNEENNHLTESNKQLIAANLNLVIQLHQLVQELKDVHINAWELSRNKTLAQYQLATSELNNFTGVAVIMILIFIILLLVYIRKAGKAEELYLAENERAIALAEQKSELLAIMSHEIRNPLTTITGTIYILNKTIRSPEQQKRLASMNHAAQMLMETINNILDASKIDHQKDEVLNLSEFNPYHEISHAIAAMSFLAENKQIYLTAEFDGDEDVLISGDAFRLKQVMINLLGNAIKYTETGGVTVKVNLRSINEHQQKLEVRIIDTGTGIPKERQAKLFTRYYQADRSGDKAGTGLGLYICHQLLVLQQGSIGVESDAGKGSCFYFNIPYKKVG